MAAADGTLEAARRPGLAVAWQGIVLVAAGCMLQPVQATAVYVRVIIYAVAISARTMNEAAS